jgi:hypothetical protein
MFMGFVLGATSVTASGVAVPLSATALTVSQVLIQAKPGNTGPIFVGDSLVCYSGVSGGIQIKTPTTNIAEPPIELKGTGVGNTIDLNKIYVNAVSGLPGVNFLYEKF